MRKVRFSKKYSQHTLEARIFTLFLDTRTSNTSENRAAHAGILRKVPVHVLYGTYQQPRMLYTYKIPGRVPGSIVYWCTTPSYVGRSSRWLRQQVSFIHFRSHEHPFLCIRYTPDYLPQLAKRDQGKERSLSATELRNQRPRLRTVTAAEDGRRDYVYT